MLPTYHAILKNNQLLWLDEEPEARQRHGSLRVLVTIVEEVQREEKQTDQKKAVSILHRMAQRNALAEIDDPVVWQRDLREDRSLPGRE